MDSVEFSVNRDAGLLRKQLKSSSLNSQLFIERFTFISSTKILCPSVHAGAVDELGDMPYYAEHCAAMLAVTYSSGQGMQRNIVSDYVTQSNPKSTYDTQFLCFRLISTLHLSRCGIGD